MTDQRRLHQIKQRPSAHSGKRYDLEAILIALNNKEDAKLLEIFEELHNTELAELIQELPSDVGPQILVVVGDVRAGEILDELPDRYLSLFFRKLKPEYVQQLIRQMSTDETADYLGIIEQAEAERVLSGMNKEDRDEMLELLSYPPQSAGGLMSTEYLAFPYNYTAGQTMDLLPREGRDAETIYYIYLVDNKDHLVGALSLRELILARPEQRLADLAKTDLVKLRVDSEQSEVREVLQRYNLLAVPVVDREMVLCGIVTHDDVADIISAEAAEDIYALAGVRVSEENDEWDLNAFQRFVRRLPWLLICALGGLISGQVISGFDELLVAIVSLAFFIPVQTDAAGNVATQSVAIVVRGLSTGELDEKRIWRYILRETCIGMFIGLACGVVMVVSAMILWQESFRFGLAIGVAMTLALTVASFLGSAFPLILHRFKVDPAVSGGPLCTMVLDAVGILIYFVSVLLILGLEM